MGGGEQVKLWDSRKIKKPLFTIAHTNSINNTTFNPTGNLMLTTCQVSCQAPSSRP